MRIALALLLALSFNLVQGQEAWPTRPIRFILPFPPGGGTDILGRLIAERLSANLGQPVVTENRGGAGGNVGAEAAARSASDGYTIVLAAPSLAISPTLYSKLNYDPVKDFAPISLVATVPNVMVTHPSVPAQTLQEFIAHARARPGACARWRSSRHSAPGSSRGAYGRGSGAEGLRGYDLVRRSRPGRHASPA